MKKDNTIFPADRYRQTVLEPLFTDFKEHFYNEMMKINYAHAVMLYEERVINHQEVVSIISGLKEIEREIDLENMEYTGEFEDLFFYIEDQLIKKIGIAIAGKLHTGRSRNDMDITMYKMKLKKLLLNLLNQLIELTKTLLEIANLNKDTVIVAYPHGQPAQPTTYAHYLAALIEILLRDIDRIFAAYKTTDNCSLGAAAITTSGFNLNRKRVAELLGFGRVQENSYGCIAAVDYLLEIYGSIKTFFISLGRFIQDLGQMTGFDLSHLYVPNEYVQISSIMPQKRNPVPVEHLRIMSSITIGYCDTVISSLHNTPFTDMNDAEDPLQVVGFKAFIEGGKVLSLVSDFVRGLEVNQQKVKEHIDQSYVTITELAETLVRKEKISFRQAHEISSEMVKDLLKSRKKLSDIDYTQFKDFFVKVIGREPLLSRDEISEALEPEYFVSVRNMFGGPAFDSITNSLSSYQKQLGKFVSIIEKESNSIIKADKKLDEELNSYMIG